MVVTTSLLNWSNRFNGLSIINPNVISLINVLFGLIR